MRHVTCAEATDVTSKVSPPKPADVGSTKAAHVTSAKATEMASAAEAAAHMAASTKSATAPMSPATTTAAAGLRGSGHKAAGEQRNCHNRRHSSSHNILLSRGRVIRPQALSKAGMAEEGHKPRDRQEMGMFNEPLHYTCVHQTERGARSSRTEA
ncbi:hypothetical protein JJC00_12185 [Bradyrhizobium diazoefficiens]|uniref:hypothetical protein n=1 Tax=Bradyrhizobium diazoefficiens TaxID=1355477 RepID=UPI00190B2200|nr:hypothetical protein [Bradyrhizobium diazoefficiens]QQO36266.1 hypothetical protein JJC00_12185 [Bradyrhizobium diazoefficiens]